MNKQEAQRYATRRLYVAATTILDAFGANPPDWLQEEAEELEAAVFYFDAHGPKRGD